MDVIGLVTQQAIDQQNAAAVGKAAWRPYIAEGHAAESPGNAGPPEPLRLPWQAQVTGDGPIAGAVRYQHAGPYPVNPEGAQVTLGAVEPASQRPLQQGGASGLPGVPSAAAGVTGRADSVVPPGVRAGLAGGAR